ncbi:hypothetical protein Pa4123_16210 [Phytohabitans aurantiacus]|uniref:Lipoprotein n=1 Tax=Phytohabitans aurantiacus TaxID=3016789 RepID=A0ABQ5QQ37_9ACTN|nr:hypothetical protein Pa4123_16210 [Phytohabitans aurantiacus]
MAVLAAALMLMGTGCGGSGDAPPDGGRALTGAERKQISQAQTRLIAECMRRQGFEYFEVAEEAPQPPEFPYGNDDPAWAAAHGFGVAYALRAVAAARAKDPNHTYVTELPAQRRDAYLAALDGDRRDPVTVRLPDGKALHQSGQGCTAQAQRRLYGDLADWVRARAMVDRLPSEYTRQVTADPGYRTALRAWSGCMAARGYAAADPAQLRTLVAPATTGTPSDAEVRAAVAEAECAARTATVRTARELQRAHAERTYANHREVIAEYQKLSVHALNVALEIVNAER